MCYLNFRQKLTCDSLCLTECSKEKDATLNRCESHQRLKEHPNSLHQFLTNLHSSMAMQTASSVDFCSCKRALKDLDQKQAHVTRNVNLLLKIQRKHPYFQGQFFTFKSLSIASDRFSSALLGAPGNPNASELSLSSFFLLRLKPSFLRTTLMAANALSQLAPLDRPFLH